jgi:hypothetical protein
MGACHLYSEFRNVTCIEAIKRPTKAFGTYCELPVGMLGTYIHIAVISVDVAWM